MRIDKLELATAQAELGLVIRELWVTRDRLLGVIGYEETLARVANELTEVRTQVQQDLRTPE